MVTGWVRSSLAALALVACLGNPAAADRKAATIAGQAQVVDGDTLKIGRTRIRLFAIDAPEGRQTCIHDDGPWRCGDAAEKRLRSLAEGRRIECHQKDRDRYGRVVAVCLAAGRDLNAEMVRSGLALAYRQFGLDYVAQEEEARRAKRGMWAGEFEPPWEWRRR